MTEQLLRDIGCVCGGLALGWWLSEFVRYVERMRGER